MTPEQRKAYLTKAAEKLQKQKDDDAQKDNEYYQRITTGNPWRIFTIGTFISLLLGILFTIDIFVDGETFTLTEDDYEYERIINMKIDPIVIVGEDNFNPDYVDFISVDYSSFSITKSSFFGNSKYISFDAHTLDIRERFYASANGSIYNTFPYLQIMLLIPLFVLLFKRQKPWFKFMRHLCLLLIFPGSLLILIFQLI